MLIRPGAFDASLEAGDPVDLRIEHDGPVIASTENLTLGLNCSPDHLTIFADIGADEPVLALLRRKALGLSVGIDLLDRNIRGRTHEVLEARLNHIAICDEPAFQGACIWIAE